MGAITKLPEIRDRSVVRSSVIASAKYSFSGLFDKFANGRTTTDKGDDTTLVGARTDETAAARFRTAAVVASVRGRVHQTALPSAISASITASIRARRRPDPRDGRRGCAGAARSGVNATAAALMAYARTGRAMFLTFCSPISTNA